MRLFRIEGVLARVSTSVLTGIDAATVEVEVETCNSGNPKFTVIGLADSTVREAKERVSAAVRRSGFALPTQVLVNLAPAEIRKEGASLDLPMALGILIASGQFDPKYLMPAAYHGELSLDGKVKKVRGAIPFALELVRSGKTSIVVPQENTKECHLLHGVKVFSAESLSQLVKALRTNSLVETAANNDQNIHSTIPIPTIADVLGQTTAKRGFLVAAAGNHNVLLIGPPGCGKSMLAERLNSLLPPLSNEEMLEVARIHSVSGADISAILCGQRPFRSPHYLVSDVGLIGGGSLPRPGEVSLSHRGVLFLDEFPEYRRSAIEALRSPLETKHVQIVRAKARYQFPASFQLVAAMNPCPCGRLGAFGANTQNVCLCSRTSIARYLQKLSQPILDRIDLHIELSPVSPDELMRDNQGRSNDSYADYPLRVAAARDLQMFRQGMLNSDLPSKVLTDGHLCSAEALRYLERAIQKIKLSARGFFRVLRIARTIADLGNEPFVQAEHISEALFFRGVDRIQKYISG